MADLALAQNDMAIEGYSTPQEMALRLADMKQKISLVQSFFKEIMVQNQDFGVIPGTDKPTLLKPGAEKLCEFYGYSPVMKQVDETVDRDTGYYRARVTVALVHRRTGVVVAEGVGEANTMEGRYRWRWTPDFKLPKGMDVNGLYCEQRKAKTGKMFTMYRLPNEDPWTLWNTVLKMAKKRGLIDATLSATRSSGIFTQDTEDLADWIDGGQVIEAEYETAQTNANNKTQSPPKQNVQQPTKKTNGAAASPTDKKRNLLWVRAKDAGWNQAALKELVKNRTGKDSSVDLTDSEIDDLINYFGPIKKLTDLLKLLEWGSENTTLYLQQQFQKDNFAQTTNEEIQKMLSELAPIAGANQAAELGEEITGEEVPF